MLPATRGEAEGAGNSSPACGGGGERSEPEGVSPLAERIAPSVIALRELTAPL